MLHDSCRCCDIIYMSIAILGKTVNNIMYFPWFTSWYCLPDMLCPTISKDKLNLPHISSCSDICYQTCISKLKIFVVLLVWYCFCSVLISCSLACFKYAISSCCFTTKKGILYSYLYRGI